MNKKEEYIKEKNKKKKIELIEELYIAEDKLRYYKNKANNLNNTLKNTRDYYRDIIKERQRDN